MDSSNDPGAVAVTTTSAVSGDTAGGRTRSCGGVGVPSSWTDADVSLSFEPPSTGTAAGPGVGSSRSSCQPRNVSQTRQNEADPGFDVPHVGQTWSAIGLLDDEAVCDVGRLGGLEERVDAP